MAGVAARLPALEDRLRVLRRLEGRRHLGRSQRRPAAARCGWRRAARTRPTTASLDSQTVKATETADSRGYDGAKKVTGRKRQIVVDSLGLLLAVLVTTADVDDAVAARQVLAPLTYQRFPRLQVVRADSAYGRYGLPEWVTQLGHFLLGLVKRPLGAVGFVLLPQRWVVERTFAWLGRYRRHSRDYERLTEVERGHDRDQYDSSDGSTPRTGAESHTISLPKPHAEKRQVSCFSNSLLAGLHSALRLRRGSICVSYDFGSRRQLLGGVYHWPEEEKGTELLAGDRMADVEGPPIKDAVYVNPKRLWMNFFAGTRPRA